MNLLTGEYNNTIDDKGRLSFPSKLKTNINQNVLVITKGLGSCLWLFTTDQWEIVQNKFMNNSSMLKEKSLMVMRHFIAPAQEIEFDKNGRLSIPQSLREYAGLTKDCTILGVAKYVEVWNAETYKHYLDENKDLFQSAAEEFNDINL